MTVKVNNRITPSVNRITARFDVLPKDAYDHWKKITPIRSGTARKRTRLQGSKIKADYNYAVPLDKGWSKQAPQGMSKPTLDYIKKRVARHILRK